MFRRIGIVVLVCSCATGLFSQSHTYLSGLVRDPMDAAVPDAAVTVVNQDTGFRRSAISHADGRYALGSLAPGVYKITVRHPGFRTLIRLGVQVEVTQPVRVDFNLPLGSMQESITVDDSPVIPPSDHSGASTVISQDQIDRIPSSGHSLSSLVEFAPGIITTPATRGESGQLTAAGQRPNANYFSVDGISANTGLSAGGLPAQATGGALPAMTALGSLHGILPLDAVSDLRVQTSTTEPEFGNLPGAQIALTSRSGSDEFHGSVFDSFSNSALDANDWFANSQGGGRAPTHTNDFGGSLGGPVWRGHTFFFVSYEGMRLLAPFAWRAAVPDLSARSGAPEAMRSLLHLFPTPNGQPLGSGLAEWTGQTSRPARFDASNIRLDHALSSRVTLFARYGQTPSWSQFGDAQVDQLSMRTRSSTFGVNARLNATLAFDLRMNASQAKLTSLWSTPGSQSCNLEPVIFALVRPPNPCDYLLRFSIAGVGQVVSGAEPRQQQTQWQAAPALALSARSHEIRLGASFLEIVPYRQQTSPSLGVIADNLTDGVSQTNLWTSVTHSQTTHSVLKQESLFAQDTWRLHPRFTLSLGLRWEFTPPLVLDSVPSLFVHATGPSYVFAGQQSIWKRTYANLAPRVGLAFRPFADGRTVVRAAWGVYYNSGLSIATDLINGGPFSLAQYTNPQDGIFPLTLTYGFMPGLRLPIVRHLSGAVEHKFGSRQTLSAVYAGSVGMNLLRREFVGSEAANPLTLLALATNNGGSSYHSFDLQYRIQAWRGLSALASYAWSHSIDNSSSDSVLYWAQAGLNASSDLGSSDFDVRHTFNAALAFETPHSLGRSRLSSLLHNWELDSVIHARTGFPITVLDSDFSQGLSFANVFRPDLVPGQPIWLMDSSLAGARVLNLAAFQAAPNSAQGNLGRNSIAGFGMWQLDLALRRDFQIAEHRSFQLRVEAFNALNHPNFADPVPFLSSPLFGQTPSMLNMMLGTGSPGSGLTPFFQNGGARSVQITLRFRF